jgi:hypothetical protein
MPNIQQMQQQMMQNPQMMRDMMNTPAMQVASAGPRAPLLSEWPVAFCMAPYCLFDSQCSLQSLMQNPELIRIM